MKAYAASAPPRSSDALFEPVDALGIARTCLRHGLEKVAMPEPWTGTSGVEFFDVAEFVAKLKESAVEGEATKNPPGRGILG